ncbi:hypothetical protein AB0I53_46860 [Saccharopolyspora sp. NPDC050389]|uniref:hypothetical protein n=1 Tax=Saccharopolyspora sp. NPDC050389 TaxID=3155516 RepID=UPI0033D0878E
MSEGLGDVGDVFNAAKTAALAVTMLDWKVAGQAYAAAMVETAGRPVEELHRLGCRYSAAPTGPPARTSSRCVPSAGAVASMLRSGCAGRTCWPAG